MFLFSIFRDTTEMERINIKKQSLHLLTAIHNNDYLAVKNLIMYLQGTKLTNTSYFSTILRILLSSNMSDNSKNFLDLCSLCLGAGADPFYRKIINNRTSGSTAFLIAIEKQLFAVLDAFITNWIYAPNPSHLLKDYLTEMIRLQEYHVIQHIYNTIKENYQSIDNESVSSTYDLLRNIGVTYNEDRGIAC
jgi:hypothetical protein